MCACMHVSSCVHVHVSINVCTCVQCVYNYVHVSIHVATCISCICVSSKCYLYLGMAPGAEEGSQFRGAK